MSVCSPETVQLRVYRQELLSDGRDASRGTVLLFLKDIPPFLKKEKHVFTFVETCIKNTCIERLIAAVRNLSHKINMDFLFSVGALLVLNTGNQRA